MKNLRTLSRNFQRKSSWSSKEIRMLNQAQNAKIDPDACNQWAGTVGGFGTGESSDRGMHILEFASNHKLTPADTLFPHKTRHTRTTWHVPSGEMHN